MRKSGKENGQKNRMNGTERIYFMKKTINKKLSKLTKVIYFDESSVTDYLQIIEGGQLVKTTELLSGDIDNGKAKVAGELSVGISSLFKNLIGIGTKVQANSELETSFKSEMLIKTILQNTILTDFLDIIEKGKSHIEVFNDIKIKVIKDSLSYVIMISPYMKMFKGDGLNLNTDLDLSIDIVKMDDSIKLAKGYFEFEGIQNNKSVILRFNIDSFKNNYKISDLLKMDLSIYGVPVGKVDRKNITIVSEINAATSDDELSAYDNPKYGEDGTGNTTASEDILTVYDVLLAGVAQHE